MEDLYIEDTDTIVSWFDVSIEDRIARYTERLENRRKQLETLDTDAADMEMYSIDEIMADIYDGREPKAERYEGILNWYDLTAETAKKLGVDHVYDIGCAYGHQSVVYEAAGIHYTGIDMYDFENPFPDNGADYIIRKYPFPMPHDSGEVRMAISHLCLGYFDSDDSELQEKNLKQISKDFEYYMCEVPWNKNNEKLYKKYFNIMWTSSIFNNFHHHGMTETRTLIMKSK